MVNEEPWVNLNVVTVDDCLDVHRYLKKEVIINDGKVIDFVFPEYDETINY